MRADTLRGPQAEPEPGGRPTVHPLVGAVWALLVVNTLGSGGTDTIIPIPVRVTQLITMGALVAAFALALLLNPRMRVRPSGYLLLLTLLLVVSVVSSAALESGVGALIRCARFAVFLATLWLLTRWWSDGLRFVRYHVRALAAVLVSVVVGLVAAPGLAMSDDYDGRLIGTVWYFPPPQVAQYAAVAAGLTIMLWLTRMTGGASVAWIALPAIGLLLLSHTRTAVVALVAGLAIAGLTLTLTDARARRALVVAGVCSGVAALAFGPVLLSWFRRGQGEDALENLTGRQKVWDLLLAEQRTPHQQLFGMGLTDKSFAGLPIDSTWLATYHEQGLVGVTIVAVIFAGLLVVAATRPPSPARACAIFLIVYCLIASYTEVGIGDASPYMLHLALAVALLTPVGSTVNGSGTFGGRPA